MKGVPLDLLQRLEVGEAGLLQMAARRVFLAVAELDL